MIESHSTIPVGGTGAGMMTLALPAMLFAKRSASMEAEFEKKVMSEETMLEEISDGISGEARSLLYALASDDNPLDEAVAERTIDDTNRWLADREARTQQRDQGAG